MAVPPSWSVDIISVGTSLISGPEVFWMSHWNETLPLAFNVAVLRRGSDVVLVNTSPPESTSAIEEEFPQMRYLQDAPAGDLVRTSRDRLIDGLAALSMSPRDQSSRMGALSHHARSSLRLTVPFLSAIHPRGSGDRLVESQAAGQRQVAASGERCPPHHSQ